MTLQYDPEFAEAATPLLSQQSQYPRPAVHDVQSRRAAIEGMANMVNKSSTLPEGIERIIRDIPGHETHATRVHHYRNRNTSGPAPAILHLHGGGFIALHPGQMEDTLVNMATESGVQVLSVDYRLAPEHPFPAALDDAWAVLQWIHANTKDLSIDPNRIAVMGESAGGGLAAGLAILARDRGLSPPLAKQILIYPMIDDRTVANHAGDLAFWTTDDNVTAWRAYLGKNVPGTQQVSAYAAPARVASVEGLPPLYLDVGQLDMFVHENVEYVQRFLAANIPTEFHLYPGVPHGFEGIMPPCEITERARENRGRAMKSF